MFLSGHSGGSVPPVHEMFLSGHSGGSVPPGNEMVLSGHSGDLSRQVTKCFYLATLGICPAS